MSTDRDAMNGRDPHVILTNVTVRVRGESTVRRLTKVLEDNGYLRRDRAPLGGFGDGMGWIWTRHPEGDAPSRDQRT